MAKNLVADLEVKLGLKGMKALSELKSALRGIGSVAKVSTQDLLKVAEAVKKYSNKGRESVSVIKGQVSALKGLQEQAAFNSRAFRELGRDIGLYEAKLKKAEKTAETSRAAIRRRGTFIKATPGRFLERDDFLRGKEVEQPFDDEGRTRPEYVQQQAQLNVLAEARARIENRLAAAVAATTRVQVDNNTKLRSASEIVKTFGAELNELPRTTNNLQMELRELRTDLGALVIGGEEYVQTLNRINQIQSQLDPQVGFDARRRQMQSDIDAAESRFERRARKLAERNAYQGGGGRGSFRDETGAMIAPGAGPFGSFRRPAVLDQPREASGLFRTIAAIGSAESKAATEMMGRSLSQVTAEIKRQAAASNGSVNSLNAQKAAFAQLRAGLDPTSQDFRELGKEIERVDRKLGKLGKKRFSMKGAAQTVGAVASAGIFGGAAGAAGALAGAPFGPGGAVIGGGIGTSVGVAAQQISSFTDYAASIRLAEKALKRLVQVEDDAVQSAHNNAVATDAIEFAIKKFNVEREDATIGMTRLSAAVLGANGTIEQAALAFLGTTAAIKATKGEAEDVRGGITALVQMFSKGKISAEELSGQLGERFPAAVTAFAKANNLNTATLQKQLKDGEVGLDKLIHFLAFATKEYTGGAIEMAESAEESGQRQKRAFDEVRRELGNQLIEVGSKLQEGIADSLIALTPVIVNMAKAVAGAIEVLVKGLVVVIKNFRNLIDIVSVLAGGLVLGKLLTVLSKVTIAAGSKGFLFSIKLLYRFIKFKLVTSVNLLIVQLRTLAITMAKNPITVIALGFTALGVSMFRASRQHKDFIDDITSGVMSLDDAGKRVDKYKKRLETLQEINAIIQQDPTAERGLAIGSASSRPLNPSGNIGRVAGLVRSLQGSDLPALDLGTRQGLTGSIRAESARITGANLAIQGRQSPGTSFDPLKNMLEALAEVERLALKGLDGGGGDGDKDITDAQLQAKIGALREATTLKELEAKFFNDIKSIQADEIEGNKKILAFYEAGVGYSRSRAQLNKELVSLEQELGSLVKKAELDLGLITEEQYEQFLIEQKRIELEKQFNALLLNEKMTKEQIAEAINKIINGMEAANKKVETFDETFERGLKDMIEIGPKLANVALQAIGGVADGLVEMIATSQANFKKFAAEILKDIAKIMMRAALAKIVAGAFGINVSAKGNVIQGGSIKPYAKGGVVAGPTVFPMAGGDMGLMGEAGPEAIMPLKRGADGKLGVEVAGRSNAIDAMNRYSRRNTAAAGGGIASEDEAIAAVQGSAAQPIDVRYTVERINDVEYVTADQFQAGMRQAASQGAKQGEQQTLKRLQMSSSTRKRLGM